MTEQLLKVDGDIREREFDTIILHRKNHKKVIYGVVVDEDRTPVENAVVKLVLLRDQNDPSSIAPIGHTFTDEFGQFLFGPLDCESTYLLKVWHKDGSKGKIKNTRIQPGEDEESKYILVYRNTSLNKNSEHVYRKIPVSQSSK